MVDDELFLVFLVPVAHSFSESYLENRLSDTKAEMEKMKIPTCEWKKTNNKNVATVQKEQLSSKILFLFSSVPDT